MTKCYGATDNFGDEGKNVLSDGLEHFGKDLNQCTGGRAAC